jgi:uncharacterized protein (DUF1697 family)
LTLTQFECAVANNRFPEAQSEPKTLHVFFLAEPSVKVNFDDLEHIKKDNESFKLVGHVFTCMHLMALVGQR